MKKALRNLLITILVALGLVILLVGFAAVDAYLLASGSSYHNFSHSDALSGYLAQPQQPNGTGVLLLHEWWGLTEDVVRMADLLAAEGYVVLAPDLYRGRLAKTVPGALLLRLTIPPASPVDVTDGGFEFLDSRLGNGTAVVGFCFGGTQAMELGRRNSEVAATVIFYGSGLISSADQVDHLGARGPVLSIFGSEDASIPLSEVHAFEEALSAAGVEHEVTVYDGVGHAFVEYSELNDEGPAQEAWNQMVAFLARELGSAEGGAQ